MMWIARLMKHSGGCVRHPLIASLRLFSPSGAAGRGDAPAPPAGPAHFMVDYLVSSCGLSTVRALRASRYLKSPEKPDAVLHLLRQAGLGDEQIRRAVSRYPRMLLFKPEKTLEPRMKALQGAGFSGSQVAELISLNPTLVCSRDLPHRLDFWRKLVGTNEDVLKAAKKVSNLLSYSLEARVIPRISLLRNLGFPDHKLGKLIIRNPRWLSVKLDWINTHVEQVKSLGFTPGSRMFMYGLLSVGTLSRSTIDAKSKLLRSYGWTQAELLSAIRRFPCILMYSEKKIHAAMGFLLNKAGCELFYLVRYPALVGFSMERRLMPRNNVLQCLKKRGLSPRAKDFWKAMRVSDHDFIVEFIIPYKDQFPEILEAYHAVLSSQGKSGIDRLRKLFNGRKLFRRTMEISPKVKLMDILSKVENYMETRSSEIARLIGVSDESVDKGLKSTLMLQRQTLANRDGVRLRTSKERERAWLDGVRQSRIFRSSLRAVAIVLTPFLLAICAKAALLAATPGLRSSGLLWTMWLARPMQFPFGHSRRFLLSSLRLFSPSAAGRGDAPAPPGGPVHFMVDYLVSSCGLSRPEALRKSSRFTHLKSHENPDAVLRLLRQAGMGDDEIRRTVQKYPKVLLVKCNKTLEPRIRVLQDAGFSSSDVAQLISMCPRIIHIRDLRHRLEFWSNVIGTNVDVVKAVKRASSLLRQSLKDRVIPRIYLLRDLGVPDDRMGKLFVRKPRLLSVKSEWIKALVEQVMGLGFPLILTYSETRIRATMCFLLNEAGCEPSYVARHPSLTSFSIEKRLVPRNYVVQSLRKVGLGSKVRDFWNTIVMSDHNFVQKFIIPYKDQLPELPEVYHAILSSQAKD
ncbi:hypothetical protein Taro_018955 [Colocasia esculenta]|uniref:Uncharacterized protein n=1 Tax=Colocasia esculenta TaxID=4460 RepID=A0A843UJX2_COLES|nr:hypothetical protein [Colocasia esculenta]